VVATLRDITEHKRAEQALRERETSSGSSPAPALHHLDGGPEQRR